MFICFVICLALAAVFACAALWYTLPPKGTKDPPTKERPPAAAQGPAEPRGQAFAQERATRAQAASHTDAGLRRVCEAAAKKYLAKYQADMAATALLKKWDRYARHANKARTRKKYAGMIRRYIKANRCPATQEALRIFRDWAGVWRNGDVITDGEKIFLPSTFELLQPMSYPDRRPFTAGGYWWLRQSYTAGIYAPQYGAATPEEHRRLDPYLDSSFLRIRENREEGTPHE